ncbi:MAG: hypothetical protein N4A38_01705 [Candidatus Gracilibacteria bacterium]|nr:hypothetical protein [Candidatus Gracilibacteria bacterium]
MKKFILFLSIIFSGIYLANFIGAITISKNSGEVLDNSTWTNISSLTNKIDVGSSNIKLNGKLYVTGELCSVIGGVKKCLGSCLDGEYWDNASLSCKTCGLGYHVSGGTCVVNNYTNTVSSPRYSGKWIFVGRGGEGGLTGTCGHGDYWGEENYINIGTGICKEYGYNYGKVTATVGNSSDPGFYIYNCSENWEWVSNSGFVGISEVKCGN